MDEFHLIRTWLAPLAGPEGLHLLDDAACFRPEDGYDLVLTKDTMVEGVHFPKGEFGRDIAQKLMRVNLSDLAAKGALPKGYLLSLALSGNISEEDIADFAAGLHRVQGEFDFALFGGDTVRTEGPIVLSASFVGQVPSGNMVRRSGAQAGDDIWVSGTIGDAFLGLKCVLGGSAGFSETDQDFLISRYYLPEPRFELKDILRNYASASADVSDGLIADIEHIASASNIAAEITLSDVPLSQPAQEWIDNQHQPGNAHAELATAGDDYEIVFTAAVQCREEIEQLALQSKLRVTRIGRCNKGEGVICLDEKGEAIELSRTGYRHFQEKTR